MDDLTPYRLACCIKGSKSRIMPDKNQNTMAMFVCLSVCVCERQLNETGRESERKREIERAELHLHYITFSNLEDAFIQSNVQGREQSN